MKPRVRSLQLAVLGVIFVACGGGGKKSADSTPTPVDTAKPAPPADKEPVPPAPDPVPVTKVAPAPIEVHAYTASEQGFLVSSYAVVQNKEILLVDSQMIQPEAEKFIEMVKGLDGTVKTIWITHAHPDHYMGLEWVTAAFPDAKVYAAPTVAESIKNNGEATLKFIGSSKYMGGTLKKLLPTKVVVPEAYDKDSLPIGEQQMLVIAYPNAEAAGQTALFEATTGTLISGDLVYNKVHHWLKDTPPDGWIAALKDLDGRPEIKAVYPGHGEPGGPELIGASLAYLQKFQEDVAASKKQKDLIAKVKADFPDYRLPAIVTFAAPSYFKK